MSQDFSREDRTALDLIESLDRQASAASTAPPLRDPPLDPEGETLKRLYLELLGLVPFELEPLAPRSEVKRSLMAKIAAGEPQRGEDLAGESPSLEAGSSFAPGPGPRRLAGAEAPPGPEAAPASPASPDAGGVVPLRPPRQAIRWPVVLAAALIVALVGLAGWMYRALVQQDQTIARLALRRESEDRRVERALIQAARAREELDELRGKLAMITSPGVEISPLRPVGSSATQPDAHGMLFVAPDHQHWLLTLHGLKPSGADRCYQLWFLSNAGPVSGGVFRAESGTPAELSSRHMPLGTKGALITQEPGSGTRAPSGPEILRAGEPFRAR